MAFAWYLIRMYDEQIEALRGVRMSSIAAAGFRNYAVADSGELWAWGHDGGRSLPLGHGEPRHCLLPKPIQSLGGVKVDAVAAGGKSTLALADDGQVYVWGSKRAAESGALGLGSSVTGAVRTPQRVPGLRVARAMG
jgi:alpha-tubulin suppressor-like RCC1 family protein